MSKIYKIFILFGLLGLFSIFLIFAYQNNDEKNNTKHEEVNNVEETTILQHSARIS